MSNKYKIGDTVRIDTRKVATEYRKYTGFYEIEGIYDDSCGNIMYKLKGIEHGVVENLLKKILKVSGDKSKQ